MIHLPSQLTSSELLCRDELPLFIDTLLHSSCSLRKADKLSEAKQCAQDAVDASQEMRNSVGQALALVHLADVLCEMDQTKAAMTRYQKAHCIFRRQPSRRQRYNEAVAAYAMGFAHQLLDNRLDALKWYQIADQLFEKEKKMWGFVNAVDQAKSCTRIRNWIKALSGYLTDVQIYANAGYIWVPIIPLDVEKEKEPATLGSKIETLDGKSFRLHSLETEQRPSLESDVVYYALDIPYEAGQSLDAATEDHVLVKWQDTPEKEGPGVLQSIIAQDFGNFKLDDQGNVRFVRTDTQVIGRESTSKSLRVGYIMALLKPISASPDTLAPPPVDLAELYAQLVSLVGGDEGTANPLIEHEYERAPDASRADLVERAITRLIRDRR